MPARVCGPCAPSNAAKSCGGVVHASLRVSARALKLLAAGQLLGLPWGAAGAMAGRLVHRTVSPVTHDLFV